MIIQRLSPEEAPFLDRAVKTQMGALGYGFEAKNWLEDPANIALASDEDIALFEGFAAPEYQMHWVFQSRGKEALKVGANLRNVMFDDYGASMLWGWTPISCSGARWFNRRLGGHSRGVFNTDGGQEEFFYLVRP